VILITEIAIVRFICDIFIEADNDLRISIARLDGRGFIIAPMATECLSNAIGCLDCGLMTIEYLDCQSRFCNKGVKNMWFLGGAENEIAAGGEINEIVRESARKYNVI
jgi:hypothetical protein